MEIAFYLLFENWQVVGVSVPNKFWTGDIITVHQHVAHINDITPWRFGCFITKFLSQHICSFSNDHDIINYSMKAHSVISHIIKRFTIQELTNIIDTLQDV